MNLKTVKRWLTDSVRVQESGCWEWLKSTNKKGYGRVGQNCSVFLKYGERLAHRISWLVYNGPIPPDACVLHKCDNPKCINPKHLFLGTIGDNNRDMHAKGRATLVRARGVEHHSHRFTEEDIKAIRTRLDNGDSHRSIARDYGVQHQSIGAIHRGQTWTHI